MAATVTIPEQIPAHIHQHTARTTHAVAPFPAAVAALAGVTKKYGATIALDQLSLTLRAGEVIALLGPNGAGKSTAVRLMLGLTEPTEGTARVFGCDPRTLTARAHVGAMLQVGNVPRVLRVREHIDLFRSYYPAPLPYKDVVEIAQLQGIEDRMYEHLSGGQRQRLLFGLALCGDPDLIFLDEPTVGMDIEARRGLWAQIRLLAERGKTVLLTTHYLEEADALASRIVVIDKGRIVAEGTPAEIKSRGAGRTIRCTTTLTADFLSTLPGVTAVKLHGGVAQVTAIRAEPVVREMLLEDPSLSDIEIAGPALEDAFLALTTTAK